MAGLGGFPLDFLTVDIFSFSHLLLDMSQEGRDNGSRGTFWAFNFDEQAGKRRNRAAK